MEGESWTDIRSDRQKGMSDIEIGRKYHIDPRTAKKDAEIIDEIGSITL